MDRFASFADLEKDFKEGVHFRVTPLDRGGTFLILAPHGGGIEHGTSETARSIAGDSLSLYLFEGMFRTARESQALHITSTKFDEPRCFELVGKFQKALAIHGCNGKEPIIYVGGKDDVLKHTFIVELTAKGYPVELGGGDYAGTYSTNICNRTSSGKGIQLELSNGFRRTLFDDWQTRKSRKATTALFSRLVSDIREVLDKEI